MHPKTMFVSLNQTAYLTGKNKTGDRVFLHISMRDLIDFAIDNDVIKELDVQSFICNIAFKSHSACSVKRAGTDKTVRFASQMG